MKKLKKEVCDLMKTVRTTEVAGESEKAMHVLMDKYKFSAWSIFGMFESPPIAEYTDSNMDLIFEEAK